jgi:hypothetical protein
MHSLRFEPRIRLTQSYSVFGGDDAKPSFHSIGRRKTRRLRRYRFSIASTPCISLAPGAGTFARFNSHAVGMKVNQRLT